jgi:hypothetical protein
LTLHRVSEEAKQMHGTVQDLSVKLVHLQSLVRPLVHPDHWIYRILLYYYALSVTRMTAQWFQALLAGGQSAVDVEHVAASALRQFGAGAGGRNGGDALVCVLELWRRMEPFYPWNEGWALHCAICRLAVLSVAAPAHPAALPYEGCLDVLTRHAPAIGPAERAALLRLVTAHKKSDKDPLAMPTRVWKSLKRLLEG